MDIPNSQSENFQLNVIIMAGGKGSRLESLTENKPKALVEISGKPVIVHLIEHLVSFGLTSLHISVGHLSCQIIEYLKNGENVGAAITYIDEVSPMGSMGSLSLFNYWKHEEFLVLNCDIFTNFNVSQFISKFRSARADMAVLTKKNEISIPWGVLTLDTNGNITNLVEKPCYSYHISAGIYLFKRKILAVLPPGPYEGWQLIQSVINHNFKVISLPLDTSYWIDIGTKENLIQAVEISEANSNN